MGGSRYTKIDLKVKYIFEKDFFNEINWKKPLISIHRQRVKRHRVKRQRVKRHWVRRQRLKSPTKGKIVKKCNKGANFF